MEQRYRTAGQAVPCEAAAEVLIVCPVRLYSESLAAALAEQSADLIHVAAAVATVAEALSAVRLGSPGVILLDQDLAQTGRAVAQLHEAAPCAALIVFGAGRGDSYATSSMKAAGAAYVPGDGSLTQLVAEVLHAARGGVVVALRDERSYVEARPVRAADGTPVDERELTWRERQVLQLIARGFSNKQIAHRLSIQVPTVKNHVHSLLAKLGVSHRTAAAALARDVLTRRAAGRSWRVRARGSGG